MGIASQFGMNSGRLLASFREFARCWNDTAGVRLVTRVLQVAHVIAAAKALKLLGWVYRFELTSQALQLFNGCLAIPH